MEHQARDANREAPEEREFRDDPIVRIRAPSRSLCRRRFNHCRAYLAAGLPDRLAPLPSFRLWSDLVRSALVWLGCDDPVLTIAARLEDDPQRQQRAELFEAWANLLRNGAFRPGEVIGEARLDDLKEGPEQMAKRVALREILTQVVADRRGEINPARLGRWLSQNTDTIAGGRKLTTDRGDKNCPRWRVIVV
jgi:putative DNA primase/helicase